MTEAQSLVSIHPIYRSHWEQRTIADLRKLRHDAFEGMKLLGTVVSPLRASVAEPAEIDGFGLKWGDDEGNPLPELVFIRYEAMAIQHPGALEKA